MKKIKITEQQADMLKAMGEPRVLKVTQEQYNRILEMEMMAEIEFSAPQPEDLSIINMDDKIYLVNKDNNAIEANLGPSSFFKGKNFCKVVYGQYDELFEGNMSEAVYKGGGQFIGNLADKCPVNTNEAEYAGKDVSKASLPSHQINKGPHGFERNLSKDVKRDMGKLYENFINELYGINENSEGKYEKLISLMEVAGLVEAGRLRKDKFEGDKDRAMAVISRGLYKLEEGCSSYAAMEAIEEALELKDITPDYFKKQLSQKSSGGDTSSIADKRAAELKRRKDAGEPEVYHGDDMERKEAIEAMAQREEEEKSERQPTSKIGKKLEEEGQDSGIVGLEIMKHEPFSSLPNTRADVDWNNRPKVNVPGSLDQQGRFTNDGDVQTGVFSKEEVVNYIQAFDKRFGEEPIFQLNPEAAWFDKVKVINPAFTQMRDKSVKGKADTLKQWGTSNETDTFGVGGHYVPGMSLGGETEHEFNAHEIIPEEGLTDLGNSIVHHGIELSDEAEAKLHKVLDLLSDYIPKPTIYPNHLIARRKELIGLIKIISELPDDQKPHGFKYLERTGIPKLIKYAEDSLEGDDNAFTAYADRLNDVYILSKQLKRNLFTEDSVDETTSLGGPGGINAKSNGNNIEYHADAFDDNDFMKAGNKLNRHESVNEDYDTEKVKKYAAEIDMYIYAPNDEAAAEQAKALAKAIDAKHGNWAKVTKLVGFHGALPYDVKVINEDAKTQTQWKGGSFVKPKDKCKKFPYCNQGADAIETKRTKDAVISNDHIVQEIANKTGKSIDEVSTILENFSNRQALECLEVCKHTNSIIKANPDTVIEVDDEGSRFLVKFKPLGIDEDNFYVEQLFDYSDDGKNWRPERRSRVLTEPLWNNKFGHHIQTDDCKLIQAGIENAKHGMATDLNTLKPINKEIS